MKEMSIFGIIALCFLIGALVGAIYCLIACMIRSSDYDDLLVKDIIFGVILGVVIWIAGVFIGIGIVTDYENAYVQSYQVAKETIEQSLEAEDLSGYKRMQLVNKAVDLNTEFAHRKVMQARWHYVYYGKDIYEGIEPIDLSGGKNV